ncbi:MAG TPA: MFS transporter [Firmicutes bacterium]|nr:MFS transporter [Bacillota bacterium]
MKKIFKDYKDAINSFSGNAKLFLVALFILSMSQGGFNTIFNLYLSSGGIRNSVIGYIISMGGIGAAIMSIPSGILSDRIGRKKVLLFGATLIPLTLLISAITIDPKILFISYLAYGAAGAILRITTNPFLAENSGIYERVHLFSLAFISTMLGNMTGSFLSGRIGNLFTTNEFLSMRYSLIFFALISSLSFIFLLIIKEIKRERDIEKLKMSFREDLSVAVKFITQRGLIALGAGFIVPFFNLYFSQVFGLKPESIGNIFSVMSIFFFVFAFFGPHLSKKIGIVKSVVFFELASLPFLVILGNRPPLTLAILSFWIRGGLMNSVAPLNSTLLMNLISEERRGTIQSFANLVWNILRSVGTFFGGILIEKRGFGLNFYITLIIYSTTILIYYLMFSKYEKVLSQKKG